MSLPRKLKTLPFRVLACQQVEKSKLGHVMEKNKLTIIFYCS